MPLGSLHPVQLVRLTVFLLDVGLQRCEVGVVIVFHTASAQADGQPVRGGAAGIGQLVPREKIVAIFQTQRRALLRQNAVNSFRNLFDSVFALRHHLSLILLLRCLCLLRGHRTDGDAYIAGECTVLELHAANNIGILQRRDAAPRFLGPLGVLTYLYFHRAGEEIRMVKRHGLHIVHPIDRNATARFIFFVFAHGQRHAGDLTCGQSMPLVGRQVQHIRAVYARFLEHPIGQIVPCRSIDGDAISRRVSQWHTAKYQHQCQQKRRQISHFSSHRGIPPVSVYIAVFAWTEIPPTRIGRLRPRRNQV